ncbi:hypothetical protein S83_035762, partial [Arachis hypogaea]
ATPRFSEDKVKQCVDPKLGAEYPPKAIAKKETPLGLATRSAHPESILQSNERAQGYNNYGTKLTGMPHKKT